MLETYTVCFFGHRQIENEMQVEERLEQAVCSLLDTDLYVEFLVGRNGAFDWLASSVIRRMQTEYQSGNSAHILVLPYLTAEYRDNQETFHAYYDEVEICQAAADALHKAALQIRNRAMADRAHLVLCCIQHARGGA